MWIADNRITETLFERCRHVLPERSQNRLLRGAKPVGINPMFRIYRYNPHESELGIHQDRGNYTSSRVDEDRELRKDQFGNQLSQMTLLIYLNEVEQGGFTTFFGADLNQPGYETQTRVSPEVGRAVMFYSDELGLEHLSPFHEGSVVTKGVKYIIRTDIMFEMSREEIWFPASAVEVVEDPSKVIEPMEAEGLSVRVKQADVAQAEVEACEAVEGWTAERLSLIHI
eukprot:TRINITY_DN5148_c0_g1_i2.p1 TRINITY_DN5148_c0_g1~~TRINITY_DN5148_c0_g1_i2.p1  ORF type:complete len:227 (-),score=34.49 TRINITY_DN5148_c0_g1_i2:124-804(-)